MLRQKGKSSNEILRVTDEILRTMKATQRPSAGASKIDMAFAVPYDPSSHDYYRDGAVKYALDHWSSSLELYNPNYYRFSNDCQNFVSQALYEGGNITMFIPDPDNLTPGGPGWYYLDYLDPGTNHVGGGWVDVGLFYTRVTDPGEAWSEVFNAGPEGIDITLPENDQVPPELSLGDVIQYDWGKDGSWDHAAIVVEFVNNVPYVATHTTDHYKSPYTLQANTNYRFIHIVRSNGYPPIKAETTFAADDAGGNPIDPCPNTNSDVGNNYLGGCFNGNSNGVTSGFLFRNIEVPPGAQIKYAYVTFTTDGPYTVRQEDPGFYYPIWVHIYGENTATPENFTSANTPAQRTNLTSGVLWQIDGNVNSFTYDTWALGGRRTTPSIKDVVASITGLGNWVYGNTLSLIFKNGVGSPYASYTRRVLGFERVHQDSDRSDDYLAARLIAAYDLGTQVPWPPIQESDPFISFGTKDGWILESSETSGKGGSINADDMTFRVGDDSYNKQYRSILHFNTSTLPDNAVITTVELKIKQGNIFGTNPFTTHGNLILDIKKPSFGNANLAKSDFEASATPGGYAGAGIFNPVPSGDWYTVTLNSAAFPYINPIGTTQFRLAFTLDDNNDLDPDFILFFSGDILTLTDRPQLIIYYYIPPS
jgi:Putative amidase domain